MSFDILIKNSEIEYEYNNEIYTAKVTLSKEDKYLEPSCQYQTPDDFVIRKEYIANTEHGIFKFMIEAAREGFNSYADFRSDVEQIEVPDNCEVITAPFFVIVEAEDFDEYQ